MKVADDHTNAGILLYSHHCQRVVALVTSAALQIDKTQCHVVSHTRICGFYYHKKSICATNPMISNVQNLYDGACDSPIVILPTHFDHSMHLLAHLHDEICYAHTALNIMQHCHHHVSSSVMTIIALQSADAFKSLMPSVGACWYFPSFEFLRALGCFFPLNSHFSNRHKAFLDARRLSTLVAQLPRLTYVFCVC